MSLKDRGYQTIRWGDFGGGINTRDSSDRIDDKQSQIMVNMCSEGNKLITTPGYSTYATPGSGITRGQAITLYNGYVMSIHNSNLYVRNISTGVTYTKTSAVANSNDIYKILTQKAFSGQIAIVCINTNVSTVENVMAYEFDGTTFTTVNEAAGVAPKWVGLSNRNFKTGLFYEGRLLLGGHPSYPSTLYYSKVGDAVVLPYNMYDFSGYPSNAQNIGDGEPIVGMISNNNELFVVKSNSFHKLFGEKDTGTVFAYIFKQQTATGALNPHCVIPVEQDIIYFDGLSMRRLSYEQNLAALSDDNVSKDIESIFTGLPQNQSANATMYFAYPFVKLCLRSTFSTNNSVNILYNIVDKSYSIQNGVEVTQGVGGFSNNKRIAYFVTSQTSTIYQDNVGVSYNGGNILCSHKSKRYVLGDGVDYKRISQVELYGKITPGLKTTIDIYVNGNIIDSRDIFYDEVLTSTTGTATFGDSLLGANGEEDTGIRDFVVRYEYYNDGRDFAFGIRSNGQGRFELHGLNLMYKNIKAYDLHS